MKRQLKNILYFIFVISCNNDSKRSETNESSNIFNPSYLDSTISTIKELNLSFGAIQGLRDDNFLYRHIVCYAEKFQIPSTVYYFIPKGNLSNFKSINIQDYFNKNKDSIKNKFNILSFEYSFINPDSAEDFHALNINLPCEIKALRLETNNFKLIETKYVNTFEELSLFKTEQILKVLRK